MTERDDESYFCGRAVEKLRPVLSCPDAEDPLTSSLTGTVREYPLDPFRTMNAGQSVTETAVAGVPVM